MLRTDVKMRGRKERDRERGRRRQWQGGKEGQEKGQKEKNSAIRTHYQTVIKN